TLLGDGELLVVGGESGTGAALASVEIYSPTRDRWRQVQPLTEPRTGHTATLLPDGRVLVVGGRGAAGALATIEIFDPRTQSWSVAPFTLQTPRFDHTATLRPDGRVVVVGGSDRFLQPLASVEIIDPARGVIVGPLLAYARTGHAASLRPEGAVIVAGGVGLETLDTVELLPPTDAGWQTLAPLAVARREHTATPLPGGALLIIGGTTTGPTAERLPGAAGSAQAGAPLAVARQRHTVTLLFDGSALVVGGVAGVDVLGSGERYFPADNEWRAVAPLNRPRFGHTATLLADGAVLVVGGEVGGVALAIAERFDPTANIWRTMPSMQFARKSHSATLLADGSVFVVGGEEGVRAAVRGDTDNASRSAERFLPTTKRWQVTAAPAAPRVDHTATLLPDGRVLVVGGVGAGITTFTAAEAYDPVSDAWMTMGAMQHLRAGHTATPLPDGTVLVVGGYDPTDESFTIFASAERFHPATNTWSPVAPMTTPRQHHVAVLLPSGEVLIVGGENRDGLVASAELYDPASDRWRTLILPDEEGRIGHAATLLLDGRVLIVGGWRPFAALNETLVYASPAVSAAPTIQQVVLDESRQVIVSGSGFRPALTASSDNTRQSAANAPLVQLRHVDSGWLAWPGQASGTLHANTLITSTALLSDSALVNGPTLVTVFVNGAGSNSRFLAGASPPVEPRNEIYLPLIAK
ncbi:MAG: hypothetical protein NZ553_01335, partial [Caldilinea sp.]|nr:hypothetical protein [Caldilinea sp.]MDW8439092.1 kelch repeat-containing protein [Caldilineaceae bacterium]